MIQGMIMAAVGMVAVVYAYELGRLDGMVLMIDRDPRKVPPGCQTSLISGITECRYDLPSGEFIVKRGA